MSYDNFSTIEDFIATLESDIALLQELMEIDEAEARYLAEIAETEHSLVQAVELGSPESLQYVVDRIKEMSEDLGI